MVNYVADQVRHYYRQSNFGGLFCARRRIRRLLRGGTAKPWTMRLQNRLQSGLLYSYLKGQPTHKVSLTDFTKPNGEVRQVCRAFGISLARPKRVLDVGCGSVFQLWRHTAQT